MQTLEVHSYYHISASSLPSVSLTKQTQAVSYAKRLIVSQCQPANCMLLSNDFLKTRKQQSSPCVVFINSCVCCTSTMCQYICSKNKVSFYKILFILFCTPYTGTHTVLVYIIQCSRPRFYKDTL